MTYDVSAVSDDYFTTVGVPVLRGRALQTSDHAKGEPVALVNETMARVMFPDRDPLTETIGYASKLPIRIVGIVRDVRQRGIEAKAPPIVYRPVRQDGASSFMTLIVRAAGDPTALYAPVREAMRAIDPTQPPPALRTMEDVLVESVAPRRFSFLVLGIFAGLAALLAAVGLGGVMTYLVAERIPEFGVRIALGARSVDVLRSVARDVGVMVAVAALLGLGGIVDRGPRAADDGLRSQHLRPVDVRRWRAVADGGGRRRLRDARVPRRESIRSPRCGRAARRCGRRVSNDPDSTLRQACALADGLFPHQVEGIAFLLGRRRAILADDMGLGKTRQAIVSLRHAAPIGPYLVVCPASVKRNWAREIQLVAADTSILVVEGSAPVAPRASWVVVNYDILGRHRDALEQVAWAALVFDEAHYLKNHTSARSKLAREITARASANAAQPLIVQLLTGTPLTSRPRDLFVLLQLVDHPLGRSFLAFAKRYCAAEKGEFGWKTGGASNIDELTVQLHGVMLRRSKDDVAGAAAEAANVAARRRCPRAPVRARSRRSWRSSRERATSSVGAVSKVVDPRKRGQTARVHHRSTAGPRDRESIRDARLRERRD